MRIYNSKSNSIEEFIPIHPGHVSLYVCGPTVYNYAHIGNARPIVVFDLLRRVLIMNGYSVDMVSNYTDVDDKIINKALEEGVSEFEIATRYIQAYQDVRVALNADSVTSTPKVTDTMPEIIAFIQKLIDADAAYCVDGDVYFSIDKINEYGEISSQNIDELVVGARIEANNEKRNPLDFSLWKKTTKGIMWDSPWGKGRPGWHTECVVMINNEFKMTQIDIHGGGQDLKFPHHENESAQCRALHHHGLANYWVHNAMLNLDGEKMSKSMGNVTWAKDYIAKFGGNLTRWLLLSTHYRLVLNITDALIEQAESEMNRIETTYKNATLKLALHDGNEDVGIDQQAFDSFKQALSDDLNVANAQAVLFAKIKACNSVLRARDIDWAILKSDVLTIEMMLDVLGITYSPVSLTEDDRSVYQSWQNAKAAKDFTLADQYRDLLTKRGIL